MIRFLEHSAATPPALDGSHDSLLVALSFAVAWLAALAAVVLLERIQNAETAARQRSWLAFGATILGIGIWSLHFIGMLAFELPVEVSYRLDLTLVSVLPAIAGSAVALKILSRRHGNHLQPMLGGTVFGLGVGIMHYLGMAAIDGPVELAYEPVMFTASLLMAIGLGILALYAYLLGRARPGNLSLRNLSVAAIMALAVSAMHYTAMHAAVFTSTVEGLPAAGVSSGWLAYAVSIGTTMIMVGTFAAVLLDRRLQTESVHRDMSREQLLEVIDAIRDGVVLMDHHDRVLLSNRALSEMTGYSQAELLGEPIYRIQYAEDPQAVLAEAEAALESVGSWQGELQGRRKDGSIMPIRVTASRVRYSRSSVPHFIATVADISEQQAAAARIRHLAYHDSLTDLPNRRLLLEQLQQLRQAGSSTHALLLIDADNFKALNDSLGQFRGDLFLQQVALRLLQHAPADRVARLGGNEFALLLAEAPGEPSALHEAVQSLRDTLEAEYDLHGSRYRSEFSIGIALAMDARNEPERLIMAAGLALQAAKRAGGQRDHWFTPALAETVANRLKLEADLREAISSGSIELHYQPQVEADGRVIGAEALARWQHPERGNVPPGEFIPLAEENGLIIALGNALLEQACVQLAAWRDDPVLRQLQLAVNVSPRQFQHPFFAEELMALMKRHQVPPGRLTIEITENLLMEDVAATQATMRQLQAEGVGFSLDDFGTGYSSLAYLKQLPFDSVKIDVSFVQDLPDDSNSAAIVRTIISLAQVLQLRVVAEGVERDNQQAFLLAHGCQTFQGFLFGRPTPSEAFAEFALAHGAPSTAAPGDDA